MAFISVILPNSLCNDRSTLYICWIQFVYETGCIPMGMVSNSQPTKGGRRNTGRTWELNEKASVPFLPAPQAVNHGCGESPGIV